jgi:hypothetical protein
LNLRETSDNKLSLIITLQRVVTNHTYILYLYVVDRITSEYEQYIQYDMRNSRCFYRNLTGPCTQSNSQSLQLKVIKIKREKIKMS